LRVLHFLEAPRGRGQAENRVARARREERNLRDHRSHRRRWARRLAGRLIPSYPRVVMRASLDVRRSARGYVRGVQARAFLLAVLVAVLAVSAGRTHAKVEISINPAMVKGPRDAAVTIIEFSDYQ